MKLVSWSVHLCLPRCQRRLPQPAAPVLGESLPGRKQWCLNSFLGTGG